MEPIEGELRERKRRLTKLRLEYAVAQREARPRDGRKAIEHDYRLAQLAYAISTAEFGVKDLEEIVAEGPNPPRRPPPDTSRQRMLSPEERKHIADETRQELLRKFPHDSDAIIRVSVAPITDLNGNPDVTIVVSSKTFPRPPDGEPSH